MNEDAQSGGAGLGAHEIARYSRHLTLPEVGVEGQLALRRASVLVVGAGGLGCPISIYLAAAGVGRIGLVDFDTVDLSNLQRQILYTARDIGRPKLDVAGERLRELNPLVSVEQHRTRFDSDNARDLVRAYDLVVDGSDNFTTRYLVNDACVLESRPDVYGSIFRFEGQVSVFHAGHGPCYRCLYPEPPPAGMVPNCAEGGVLGVLAGIVGTLQAIEAIKLILAQGDPLRGRLLLIDALEMRFRELRFRRNPECALCGSQPTITDAVAGEVVCAADTDQPMPATVSVAELKRRMAGDPPPIVLDVRTPEEWAICHIAGATLIPLGELDQRWTELDPTRETVVYCHVGMRSAMAAGLLRRNGFERASNLGGGIEAWAREIDPSMPRY